MILFPSVVIFRKSQDPIYSSTDALWPGHARCGTAEEHPVRPLWRQLLESWDKTNLPCPDRLHTQALLQSAADWHRDSYVSLARAEACGGNINADLRGQIRGLVDQIAEIVPPNPQVHKLWVDPAPLRLIKAQLCAEPKPAAPPVAGVSRSQPTWLGCWFMGSDLPDPERRAVAAGNTAPLQWQEGNGWGSQLLADLWVTLTPIWQVGSYRPKADSDRAKTITVRSLHLTGGQTHYGTIIFWEVEPVGEIPNLAWVEIEAAGLGHGRSVPIRLAVVD